MGAAGLGRLAAAVRKDHSLDRLRQRTAFVDLMLLIYFCGWSADRVLKTLQGMASCFDKMVVRNLPLINISANVLQRVLRRRD